MTPQRWLRRAILGLAWALLPVAPLSARGRAAPIVVLVSADVTERARATMSPELWSKLLDAYVGANAVPFVGPNAPTLEDCRSVGADYLVVAPFDVRPRLPGLANATGRVAARTHLVVTNCIDGGVLADRVVTFDSDPPTSATDGDLESVPEITWGKSVPAALGAFPAVFARVARIISVRSPLAFVDIRGGTLRAGDRLRDYAHSDRSRRASAIVMTVTQVFDRYLEVLFSGLGDQPEIGDLVEPIPVDAGPTPR